VKLTLGKPTAAIDPTLENLFVRPVVLKSGPRLAFVWRHATRDITKNHGAPRRSACSSTLIGSDFLDAHLFTSTQSAQLETGPGEIRASPAAAGERAGPNRPGNDRRKSRPIRPEAPWLGRSG
jgi:hypothetical protein